MDPNKWGEIYAKGGIGADIIIKIAPKNWIVSRYNRGPTGKSEVEYTIFHELWHYIVARIGNKNKYRDYGEGHIESRAAREVHKMRENRENRCK